MSALLLLLVALQTPVPTRESVRPPVIRVQPIQWDALPPLPFRTPPTITPPMTSYVAREMVRTRCPMPVKSGGRMRVTADVAVLMGSDGAIRLTIPHAIACPTVEQYAAGLVQSFARNNVSRRNVEEGAWYRATIVFDWAA